MVGEVEDVGCKEGWRDASVRKGRSGSVQSGRGVSAQVILSPVGCGTNSLPLSNLPLPRTHQPRRQPAQLPRPHGHLPRKLRTRQVQPVHVAVVVQEALQHLAVGWREAFGGSLHLRAAIYAFWSV